MKVAVIGCGNMASLVVKRMHDNDKSISFYTYTPTQTKAAALAQKVQGQVIGKLSDFSSLKIDYWLIGCKPQQVEQLAEQAQGLLKGKNIVSMLAATSVEKLATIFDSKNVLRIMPNTPIGLAHGTTLYFAHPHLSEKVQGPFLTSLKEGNYLLETKSEQELDELTVFSGSGPAYVFYFAYTLEQKLKSMGYDAKKSRALINQLFVGSSALMQKSDLELSELIDQVTSRGGVTIEAIKHFRAADLETISSQAIDKAIKRSEQITQELK